MIYSTYSNRFRAGRFAIRLAYAGLLGLLIATAPSLASDDADVRPNVVLIVIDSLRADSLSSYGHSRVTSPNIDALAREGFMFTNAYTIAASTGPAMAGMMTGHLPYYVDGEILYRDRHGLGRFATEGEDGGYAHNSGIPRAMDTLAERLKREGYKTAAFVTNAHVKEVFNFDQGFDHFEDLCSITNQSPHSPAGEVSDRVNAWLTTQKEEPFFIYVHYNDVHYPYLPPREFLNVFPFARSPLNDQLLQTAWRNETDLALDPNSNALEHAKGLYDTEIWYTDKSIGSVINHLDTNGLADSTAVIVTADHGEEFLDHGGTIHKGKLFDELMHIPMVGRLPDGKSLKLDNIVRNIDVMPTVLAMAGVDVSGESFDAESFLPMLHGVAPTTERDVFSNFPQRSRGPHVQMIRTVKHKLIYFPSVPNESQFFDLIDDPLEKKNLFDANQPNVKRLTKRLSEITIPLDAASKLNPLYTDKASKEKGKRRNIVVESLESLSPEARRKLVIRALEEAKEEAAKEFEGLDEETLDQLEALGYVD